MVPSSLPCSDSDSATRAPSDDGTQKSIAVSPEGSIALGSTRTRSVAVSTRSDSATRNSYCLGGWRFSAKYTNPAGAENAVTLCDLGILADQAAEPIAPE